MINYLAESAAYKVYAIYESVYLKEKPTSDTQDGFSEADQFIAWHYGDPTSAIVLPTGKHIIVAGCGLSLYDTERREEAHILDEPDKILWTNALHQDSLDDMNCEFRFVAFNKDDVMRVFKMNVSTRKIEQLD